MSEAMNNVVVTIPRDGLGRFLPGAPGKPKGCRHKLGYDFVKALQADFAEHGVRAIRDCREKNPAAYLAVIVKLMPQDNALDGEAIQRVIFEAPLSESEWFQLYGRKALPSDERQ